MSFCPYCGVKIPESSGFCTQCGAKLKAHSAPAAPPQKASAAPTRDDRKARADASSSRLKSNYATPSKEPLRSTMKEPSRDTAKETSRPASYESPRSSAPSTPKTSTYDTPRSSTYSAPHPATRTAPDAAKGKSGGSGVKTLFIILAAFFFTTTLALAFFTLDFKKQSDKYREDYLSASNKLTTATRQKDEADKKYESLQNEYYELKNSAEVTSYNEIREFITSSDASLYNKKSAFCTTTNVVVLKTGDKVPIEVHSTLNCVLTWKADTVKYAECKWDDKWKTSENIDFWVTGKEPGVEIVTFTNEKNSDYFKVLVVTVG